MKNKMNKKFVSVFRESWDKSARGIPSFYLINGVPRSGKTEAVIRFIERISFLISSKEILYRSSLPEALTGHLYKVIILDDIEKDTSELRQLKHMENLYYNIMNHLASNGIFILIGSVLGEGSLSMRIQKNMFLDKAFPKFKVINAMESHHPVEPDSLNSYQREFLLNNGVGYMEKWIEFQKSLPYYEEEPTDE